MPFIEILEGKFVFNLPRMMSVSSSSNDNRLVGNRIHVIFMRRRSNGSLTPTFSMVKCNCSVINKLIFFIKVAGL